MSQIIFTPLKELKNNSIKYDVMFSCSLFQMRNSYRNFDFYLNKLLNWIYKIPKNSYLRLYVDSTVLTNKKFIGLLDSKFSRLEIILFEAPAFLDSEGFHDGAFGMIPRFYPLFNPPENAEYIWITDVDINFNFIKFDILSEMKKYKAKSFYYSKSCYNKPWDLGIEYPILNSKLIVKTDLNLYKGNLTRFLNDVLNKKYNYIFKEIKELYPKFIFDNIKFFPYGFDELFVYLYIYPELIKYKRIIHVAYEFNEFILNKLQVSKEIKQRYFELKNQAWKGTINKKYFTELVNIVDYIYSLIGPENELYKCKQEYLKNKKYIDFSKSDIGLYAKLYL